MTLGGVGIFLAQRTLATTISPPASEAFGRERIRAGKALPRGSDKLGQRGELGLVALPELPDVPRVPDPEAAEPDWALPAPLVPDVPDMPAAPAPDVPLPAVPGLIWPVLPLLAPPPADDEPAPAPPAPPAPPPPPPPPCAYASAETARTSAMLIASTFTVFSIVFSPECCPLTISESLHHRFLGSTIARGSFRGLAMRAASNLDTHPRPARCARWPTQGDFTTTRSNGVGF